MEIPQQNYVLTTNRLILRKFIPQDAADLYRLNADPIVMEYTGDTPFASVQEAETFIMGYKEYELHGFGRWALLTKQRGHFIGWCGLKKNHEGYVDIGFRLFRQMWRKGYATEASLAVLTYGFTKLGMDEIIGRASIHNLRSIKVLETLKMSFWKRELTKDMGEVVYYRIKRPKNLESID